MEVNVAEEGMEVSDVGKVIQVSAVGEEVSLSAVGEGVPDDDLVELKFSLHVQVKVTRPETVT